MTMNRQSPMQSHRARRGNAGVGLIEVLIAIVILAFGMLGIAALQAAALRSSQSSINRNEAIAQSYAVLDAMRANRSNTLLGAYNLGTYDATNPSNTSWTCAVPDVNGTLAGADLNEWMTRLQSTQGLGPTACAIIAPVSGIQDTYQVRIRWDDSRGNAGKATQPTNQSTATMSRL